MPLESHTYDYINIQNAVVEYDEMTCRLIYSQPDENIRVYERISFVEEDLLQQWKCKWVTFLQNKFGEEIKNTRELVEYTIQSAEVNYYQNIEMALIPAGVKYMDFYKRASLNGLIEGLKDFGCTNVAEDDFICRDKALRNGVIVFEPLEFTPVQPVSFTEVVTHESAEDANDGMIDITVVDGVGPFTYSLDGGPDTPIAQITGLAPGDHTLLIKGNDSGKSVVKTITINAYSA